jgi:chromosome segregation ATPase
MTRLESAKKRLSDALDALESSVRANDAQTREQLKNLSELESLKDERERLLGRIAALEDETHELAGLTQEIEVRLDGAIAELRDALGRN